jgi:UDP-N-acetylglucosamine diphosphorylase/glucosamine-1-phosphate N-acetyltransferase
MECVVLAAGEGKRMRPLTATRPKVMLPLANRPMVEHLIVAAKNAGLNDFVLVVGYREQEVRNYFGDGSAWGVSIRYITQRIQMGTADALNATKEVVGDKFLLLNGDMLLKSTDIRDFSRQETPSIAIFPYDHPEEYGVLTVEGDIVTGLIEKSQNPVSNLINAGAYLFDTDIFGILSNLPLSERGEYELTDALMRYIEQGVLKSHQLSSWYDVGAPWTLLNANEEMLGTIPITIKGIIEERVTIKGDVSVEEGSVIKAGTYIEGPCCIGKNCRIGPNAYIRGATSIGDGCHIGHSTEIKNSVILPDTKVPHFNYIGDSIVGSGCNFGAGTKVANLRHDRRDIHVGGINTGRKKFGAVIGDNVQFGINCSVNVGTIVGSDVRIAPHSFIEGNIADGTIVR